MDWEVFTRLVDELAPQSEALMLFNRGESTLHPKFYEAIEYAGKKTKVIISTNGVAINPDRFFATQGDKLLVISLPAGNRKTYKEITGTDNFFIVKRNIQELQKRKPNNVEMYVKMVKQAENQGHEELLKKFCNHVVVVEDSNGANIHNYTECGQPDNVPTWRYDGTRSVCCRAEEDYTPENYELGKKRLLTSCKNCNIC